MIPKEVVEKVNRRRLQYWEIYLEGLKNTRRATIEQVEDKILELKKALEYAD